MGFFRVLFLFFFDMRFCLFVLFRSLEKVLYLWEFLRFGFVVGIVEGNWNRMLINL